MIKIVLTYILAVPGIFCASLYGATSRDFLSQCRNGEISAEDLKLIESEIKHHAPRFSFKNAEACEEADELRHGVWVISSSTAFQKLKNPAPIEFFPELRTFTGNYFGSLASVDCKSWKRLGDVALTPRMTKKDFPLKNCENIEKLEIVGTQKTLDDVSWETLANRFSNLTYLVIQINDGEITKIAGKLNLFKGLAKLAFYSLEPITDFTSLRQLRDLKRFNASPVAPRDRLKCPVNDVSRGLREFCVEALKGK